MAAEELADEEARRRWGDEKGMLVFTFVKPDDPVAAVDIFLDPPFADFQAAYDRAVLVDLEGTAVRVAHVDDLIATKTGTGRAKDADDIAALRALNDEE